MCGTPKNETFTGSPRSTKHESVLVSRCVIVAPDGREVPFEFDGSLRHRLLNGLDDIALTLQHEADIDAYETAHGIA